MSTRRRFMGLGLGLGAAAVLRGVPASAQAKTEDSKVPPSIAALTSMRDQAKPITVDERKQRMARAMELMAQNKMDAFVLCGGTSTVYFTNVRWWVSERFFAIVLPAKGKPIVVCPSFEADRAREQLKQSPLDDYELVTWHEDADPYGLLSFALRDRGMGTATIGVEERIQFAFSDGMAKALPTAKWVSATPITAGCRMIKSAHELALLTLANHVTLAAYEAAYKALQPGMTQNDVERLVSQAHQKLGFSGGAGVQVGEYSALPHGSITPQVIKEGTIIMMDGGCGVEGYESDITRTYVLGKPTDKMKKVFDIVHTAQSTALATAKPGVAAETVDAAARKVIEDAGFGPDYRFFGHRVGHGIGMDGHEWPYLVRGDKIALAPGMCFSDEPGIYIMGEFGVRLEDCMHITDGGAELFTPQSSSLEHPF